MKSAEIIKIIERDGWLRCQQKGRVTTLSLKKIYPLNLKGVVSTHHLIPKIQQVVDELRAEGLDILSAHLQKISALIFKHIQIYGTYHFEDI